MRLHHLEISAFGPFAGDVSVDFDHLSDAGLFLLSGATGAGKTSVLDAVCFALYGDVPGDRGAARRLRCDQAAPGAAPRVVLEATLSGRRFRIVRSPSWERPKKRGTGVTTQQASVTISERVDGVWQPLSTRLDETGHLVTRLVGMNLTQFTQVALLPQGRFQAFLRARSEERHQLLQRLFRTGRFEEVERWLRDRRVALRRQSDAAHQDVADLVSRISETAGVALPDGWDVRDLRVPAATGDLTAWSTELSQRAVAERSAADDALASAATAETTARVALEEGRALVARRRRLDAAAAEHAQMLDDSDEQETARAALDAARRAAAVAPLHRLARAAEIAFDRASARASAASSRAAEQLGVLVVDAETLASAVSEATDHVALVRSALPREARCHEVEAGLAAARRRHVAAQAELDELAAERRSLPARIAALRADLVEATRATGAVPLAEGRVQDLRGRIDAHRRAARLDADLAAAREALAVAVHEASRLREVWLDVREARLEGMAAEIAGALAVGACCPVCGSADHPHRAVPVPGTPDSAAEKQALKELDDGKATELLHQERVRELTTLLAVARDQAGDLPVDEQAALLEEAGAQLAELQALSAREATVRADLGRAEADHERLDGAIRALELELGTLAASTATLTAELERVRAEVEGLLRGTGARDLAELLDLTQRQAAAGRDALAALAEKATAERALGESRSQLETAAAESGFASSREAAAAQLGMDELRDLERLVRDHDQRLAALAAVLEEPGAAELAAAELPEVPVLVSTHTEALEALGHARARATRAAAGHERLHVLVCDLAAALDAWAPIRDELDLVTRVSSFAEGKAADNRLQMRLSAYVLAYRLSQVVAAANERLASMSDRRYSLEHTGRRGAGETRGGLSLLVRDDWSGEARDPATLSGGETFVASLALALGLADVITQEAGGADLDTLFVDEGFGSLDADTLDDVMDTLDSLRDGGRVVGVVSHVAEMRDRIPTQLEVTKARRGSTLSVTR
ncbi:AAA family ATPase [Nocardioides sp. MAHUQ-72]|uniref:AAA family ATPase n=1 Tax=unclassified Nocardioides TaxID=2615069 RepID=UPI003616F11D